MQIEVCASTINSVLNAKLANAHRVELCTELGLGGLTPSFGMIKQATLLDLPIHVLIRPRSGHFVYSKDEIKMMYDDIIQCKEMGCAGVVVGVLNKTYDLAHEVLATMVALARPMQITFHRAFDLVKDPQKTLETLVDLGFDRILSSGQKNTALEGLPLLQKILQWSDHRIEIMPGGGINFDNCLSFRDAGFEHLHLSGFKSISLEAPPSHLTTSFSFLEQPIGHSDLATLQKVIKKLQE